MARSEIFLLLPVYTETVGQHDYISGIYIISNAELKEYIGKIKETGDFLEIENYKGYYDADNVKAFLLPIRILEDCYPNAITRFRSVMNKWGENWRKEKKQNGMETYMCFGKRIQDDTLCEITERKCLSTDGSTFLLVDGGDALGCKKEIFSILRLGKNIEIEVRKLDIKKIAAWFESNRKPKRVFSWNPKHGEYGKGAYPSNKGDKVSVLMGSRNEADALLHKAVGTNLKKLFYFDEEYNQYIEFKRERDNVYHAYHLADEDVKRIPEVVKQRIKKLL